MRVVTLSVLALFVAGCTPGGDQSAASPVAASQRPDAALADIERRSGGRLGAVVMDGGGRIIVAHRADERFALCSTFKLPLAAVILAEAEMGRIDIDQPLAIDAQDAVGHAPVIAARLASGQSAISVIDAARAAVVESDNGAANLLLALVGGPTAFTQHWRRLVQDQVTRLDRDEPALNENLPGDPRDTSTPQALATAMERVFGQSALASGAVERLEQWTVESQTGQARVRAALPEGWRGGDKTGTCSRAGGDHPQYNDIGWFRDARGQLYLFAVMLDHPRTGWDASQAIIADVGRLAVQRINAVP